MARRGSGETSARPSLRARVFCSSMAWRTAGMPPPQELLGHRQLLGSQLGQRRVAVGRHGLQTPGPLGPLAPGRAAPGALAGVGPGRPIAPGCSVGARAAFGPRPSIGSRRALGPGTACGRRVAAVGAPGRAALTATLVVGPATTTGPVPAGPRPRPSARALVASPAAFLAPAPARGEDDRHPARGAVASGADDLDALEGPAPGIGLGSQHGRHHDAVDLELGVGPKHVAHLGAVGQEGPFEGSPGLARARGGATSTCRRRVELVSSMSILRAMAEDHATVGAGTGRNVVRVGTPPCASDCCGGAENNGQRAPWPVLVP